MTPDGRVMVAPFRAANLSIWDPEEGTVEVVPLPRVDHGSASIVMSSRGAIAVSGSFGGTHLLNRRGSTWRGFRESEMWRHVLTFSPDGSRLLAFVQGDPFVLDLDTDPPHQIEVERLDRAAAAVWQGDAILAYSVSSGLIRIDLETGERAIVWKASAGQVEPTEDDSEDDSVKFDSLLACSEDGRWVAAFGVEDECSLRLFDVPLRPSWNLTPDEGSIPAWSAVQNLQFAANDRLLHFDYHGTLHIWDPVRRCRLGSLVFGVGRGWGDWSISPDGERIAYRAQDCIHVWDWRPLFESP